MRWRPGYDRHWPISKIRIVVNGGERGRVSGELGWICLSVGEKLTRRSGGTIVGSMHHHELGSRSVPPPPVVSSENKLPHANMR